MAERKFPGLTFKQIETSAVKPSAVSPERWQTGMAVVKDLMRTGQPVNVIEDSHVGPDVPNKYYVTGTGVTVDYMPHWHYAIVDGKERTHVALPEAESPIDETQVHPAVAKLNEVIVKSWM